MTTLYDFALKIETSWAKNDVNDTHREKVVRYFIQYKNSLKYKVGCFWRF